MGALPIPSGPAELTPAWLTAALRQAGVLPEGSVERADLAPLGQGILGRLFRAVLAYDRDREGAPRSLAIKVPSADTDCE